MFDYKLRLQMDYHIATLATIILLRYAMSFVLVFTCCKTVLSDFLH